MDIASSQSAGDVLLEAKHDALAKDSVKMNVTLKLDEPQIAKTLTINNDLKSDLREIDEKVNTIDDATPIKKTEKSPGGKRVRISVRNDLNTAHNTITSPMNVTSNQTRASIHKSTPEKVLKVPSQLNLGMQENVQNNISYINSQLIASRKQMIGRRDNRPDTLNQLISPKN